ncbi:MAG: hypothetical protein MSS60_06285 [Clostridiales bacterium]|nr:hypothetical protein [Clostridiales bacterium]
MTNIELQMAKELGLNADDFKPKDKGTEVEDALCELAEMLAEQYNAIREIAELIGGMDNG